MANALYPKGKAHLLGLATKADLVADTIKVILNASGTNPYGSTNEYVSDLVAGGIVARSNALASKTVTSGVFAAANTTIAAVSGITIDSLIIYKDTGADGTSPVICWLDVTPYAPTGGDITIAWNVAGIFSI